MNCQSLPLTRPALHSLTRRHFFGKCAWGLAGVALAARPAHFAPKAKRLIYLFMEGAPSQLDLFDYKPRLAELNMKPCPEEMIKGERFAFIKGVPKILATPHKFS